MSEHRYTLEVVQHDWFTEPLTITDVVLNGFIAQQVIIKDNHTNNYCAYDDTFTEPNKDYACPRRFEDAMQTVGSLNQAYNYQVDNEERKKLWDDLLKQPKTIE